MTKYTLEGNDCFIGEFHSKKEAITTLERLCKEIVKDIPDFFINGDKEFMLVRGWESDFNNEDEWNAQYELYPTPTFYWNGEKIVEGTDPNAWWLRE